MRPTVNHLSISVVRSEALFVSALQPSEEPGAEQVRLAVAAALRQTVGWGCAERVAQEFGEHPESAASRMRWARRMVAEAFSGSEWPGSRPRRPDRCPAERAA